MYTVPIKSVLLILTSLFFIAGSIAPRPPPKDATKVYKGQLLERKLPLLVFIFQSMITIFSAANAAVIIALSNPHPYSTGVLSQLCPAHPSAITLFTSTTLSFLLGAMFVVSGMLLRFWCYGTLGPMFTFQVGIKKEHKLVTGGPYSVVRHPSYTGFFLMLAGVVLTLFSKGSYVMECGAMSTPARWAVYAFFAQEAFFWRSVWKRAPVEDAMLRESFGEEWVRYSQRVPYRFFPGIY